VVVITAFKNIYNGLKLPTQDESESSFAKRIVQQIDFVKFLGIFGFSTKKL